jgi:hypothetical protein
MALLDVSEAFDVSFMEPVTIVRRTQVLTNGFVSTTEVTLTAQAVVMPASPTDLQRLPEAEWTNKAISVYSIDRLQGVTPTTLPDKVIWHGSNYVVADLQDFSHWGRGFVHAICTSMDATDPAPAPVPLS